MIANTLFFLLEIMSSPKQIVQIAKDVVAAALFLISSGLVWWYTHKLIVAGIIIALAIDLAVVVWSIIERKYTLADVKDFWGVVCLIIIGSVALASGDATSDRLAYSIIFGVLGLIDCTCLILQCTHILLIYNELLLGEESDETVNDE